MESLNLLVKNVKCDGCVGNIKTGLEAEANVQTVDVDKNTGAVSIQGNNLDRSAILVKLQELGYPENS